MADKLAQWLDEMEARAEKATPGQIDVVRHGPLTSTYIGTQPLAEYYCGRDKGDEQPLADAEHPAAWSPDVARAVLAVVRAADRWDAAAYNHGGEGPERNRQEMNASENDLLDTLAALRRIVEKAPEAR